MGRKGRKPKILEAKNTEKEFKSRERLRSIYNAPGESEYPVSPILNNTLNIDHDLIKQQSKEVMETISITPKETDQDLSGNASFYQTQFEELAERFVNLDNENHGLKKRCEELDQAVIAANEKLKQCETENSKLKEEIFLAKLKLEEKNNTIEGLKSKIQLIEKNLPHNFNLKSIFSRKNSYESLNGYETWI